MGCPGGSDLLWLPRSRHRAEAVSRCSFHVHGAGGERTGTRKHRAGRRSGKGKPGRAWRTLVCPNRAHLRLYIMVHLLKILFLSWHTHSPAHGVHGAGSSWHSLPNFQTLRGWKYSRKLAFASPAPLLHSAPRDRFSQQGDLLTWGPPECASFPVQPSLPKAVTCPSGHFPRQPQPWRSLRTPKCTNCSIDALPKRRHSKCQEHSTVV